MDENKIAELDAALVNAAKDVKLLNALAWPADSEEKFLRDWRAGRAVLPDSKLQSRDLTASIAALEAIAAQCGDDDPVEKFLHETSHSYATAARMLGAIGTREFTSHSVKLYGRPDYVYRLQGMTVVDAARFFLQVTDDLLDTRHVPPTDFNISANDFATWLQTHVDAYFGSGAVTVKLDSELSAKAIAGASRAGICLRCPRARPTHSRVSRPWRH